MVSYTWWMLRVSTFLSTLVWMRSSCTSLLSWAAVQRLLYVWLINYLVFVAYSFACWVVIYPTFLSPLRNVPQASGASFIIGHMISFAKEPAGVLWRAWLDETRYDGMLKVIGFWHEEELLVMSPEANAEVLIHKSYDFEKPAHIKRIAAKILGDGILFAEGDVHKQQRRALAPAFAFRHIKDLYPMFWDRSLRLMKAMQEQGEHTDTDSEKYVTVEVSSWASKATLSIIEEAAMGVDLRSIEDPEESLRLTYQTIMKPGVSSQVVQFLSVFCPLWLTRNIPTALNIAVKKNEALIRDICVAQMDHIELLEKDGSPLPNTILSTLVKSKQFSTAEIVEQMKTFIFAGHETTATALTWAVYLLCKHPDMQKRLHTELLTALGPPSSSTTTSTTSTNSDPYSSIPTLPYLQAFTSEVLRLYPPVPATFRQAIRPTTISSTPIPKNTLIVLLPWAVNVDREVWGDDAETFNPERWFAGGGGGDSSAGKGEGGGQSRDRNATKAATLTFLHGPHSCIGERFARVELAFLVAGWVWWSLSNGEKETVMVLEDPEREVLVDVVSDVTAKIRGGLRVRLPGLG